MLCFQIWSYVSGAMLWTMLLSGLTHQFAELFAALAGLVVGAVVATTGASPGVWVTGKAHGGPIAAGSSGSMLDWQPASMKAAVSIAGINANLDFMFTSGAL